MAEGKPQRYLAVYRTHYVPRGWRGTHGYWMAACGASFDGMADLQARRIADVTCTDCRAALTRHPARAPWVKPTGGPHYVVNTYCLRCDGLAVPISATRYRCADCGFTLTPSNVVARRERFDRDK